MRSLKELVCSLISCSLSLVAAVLFVATMPSAPLWGQAAASGTIAGQITDAMRDVRPKKSAGS